ncbi:RNA polymerase-associated protein RapA [Paraliobacillus sp. PM-2]|uniref:DEAD/DEAH box helicase n=1 Tax=Paraliobacillus sp. PM-2 TaxID=1462524 RepID=UPI00061B909D|nr:SNF2-related protein [Paraliobacillus sp. PM-2]CQR46829.1 RNA polymerase-associated protein RapA [Paraliobacillus sp. PM-2]
MQIQLQRDQTFLKDFEERLAKDQALSSWDLFLLSYQAAEAKQIKHFNELMTPSLLPHMTFLSHQLDCVKQVIEQMNGRAILADEVGLGKTIEAGLLLKEYMIRGLVKKALILVPASLVNQWATELTQKFYIPVVTSRKRPTWDQDNIMITSIDLAKREPHYSTILEQQYDFVLVDEAHKLKNHQTKSHQFIRALKKKYCLLLTATPIQNKLSDIFNLVSILKPGYLGDFKTFSEKFGKNNKALENDTHLKQLIKQVMVRNRRTDTGLEWTKRHVETIWIDFSKEEMEAYEALKELTSTKASFAKITYLRELCSSREACYLSIKKNTEEDHKDYQDYATLLEMIETLPNHAKAIKVAELVQSINDKCIIFTEYRATQLYLQWVLQQHGITSVPFRGGFKRGKKDWMKQLFEHKAQVLIATEAGGEGINLQFCHHMINYDLPWNPMRLEQRIGRIHRYGQTKDVHIYNFAIRHTIEEHVLQLLYNKIGLFERIIGNLDAILADLELSNMDKEMEQIFLQSQSEGEAKIKLDNLSEIITNNLSQKEQENQYGNRESS